MIINHDIDNVCRSKSFDKSNEVYIRDLLYDIIITNIPGSKILKDILDKLILSDKISDVCKYDIIEIMALYEFRVINGRRMIVHLEAAILHIMAVIYKLNYGLYLTWTN